MRQWTIDAFASGLFRGNPACVVEPFDAWPDPAWMQSLAQENNQAETAFLLKTDQPDRFGLRWFTPTMEMPLCGHATLASAHVLFHELGLETEAAIFETRQSGHLMVYRKGPLYEMDFPSLPPRRVEVPAALTAALGAEPSEVYAGHYGVAVFESAAAVRALKPDFAALEKIVALDLAESRGNIVAAGPSDDPAFDVVDRFFAPGSGILEDPATGSAHCILAPLYAEKLGRPSVRYFQAFPGRGAEIETELRGDRVRLRGRAVTFAEARIRV